MNASTCFFALPNPINEFNSAKTASRDSVFILLEFFGLDFFTTSLGSKLSKVSGLSVLCFESSLSFSIVAGGLKYEFVISSLISTGSCKSMRSKNFSASSI